MDSIILKRQYAKYTKSGLIGLLIASSMVFLSNFIGEWHFIIRLEDRLLWSLPTIPAMLLSTLCGSHMAMGIEFIMFAVCAVQGDAPSYYLLTPLLIASITAFYPVRKHWYRRLDLTAAAVLIQTVLTGSSLVFMDYIRTESFPPERVIWNLFNLTFINAVLISGFAYVFFNHAPEHIKALFYSGIFYKNARPENGLSFKTHSNLARKILFLLLIEMVTICLAIVLFMFMLFSNQTDSVPVGGAGPLLQSQAPLTFSEQLPSERIMHIKQLLSLLNIAIPVALIANFYAQLNIVNPVKIMSLAVEDFTTCTIEGKKEPQLNIDSLQINTHDEITELYQTLRIMTSTITEYIDKIQHEKQLEQDLMIAKEAGKAKSAFLANMSHEIRTPINAVLGLDEMILRECTDKQALMYASEIKSAGRSLLGIINDILDFSKIESGKMEIIPVKYDLSSTINDLMNMISQRAKEKGLDFKVDVDSSMPHILYGDEIRIKQCITNILTNSVKYTEEGSVSMHVTAKPAAEGSIRLCITISDTGIGMKKEDLPKLFQAFERIEESRNRQIEGTGLGMNIVHELLTLMGSTLNVQSEYGKGSSFSFEVEQEVLDKEPIGDFMETYRKSLENNEVYRESFRAPGAHILVVDDTRLNLMIFTELLKQTQVQIDTATSGQEALVKSVQNEYDILFIDHRMPGMDGVETLHALNEMEDNRNKGKPCIAQTANAVNGAREMYLAEGFSDYITKPIDSAKLEAMIIKYLPKELVQLVGRREKPQEELPALDGVDGEEALRNCGSRDLFIKTAQTFRESIGEKAGLIEGYAKDGDCKNYTVLVHALKSSARLIGATELSALAAELEKSGDDGNMQDIEARTPRLLELYRSYTERLAPVCKQHDSPRKPIGAEEYKKTLEDVKAYVQAFDYATADQLVAMLEECQLPAGEEERFSKIRKALTAVDYEELSNLL